MQYSFDYGNRLRDVSGLEGGYLYDAYGRRVGQTNSSGTIWSFYDQSGQLVFQQARHGTTHDYLYLGGHLVAIRDYDTSGIARVMRYQHTDAQGSIVRQTDKSGVEIGGYIYNAYGKPLGGAVQDGPGYTGHVMDASTGLTYMQQRYYDPDAMRFLSMDPVEADSAGGNLGRYWYASDNPYKFTDPDGRASAQRDCGTNGCSADAQKARRKAMRERLESGSLTNKILGSAAFISGISATGSAAIERTPATISAGNSSGSGQSSAASSQSAKVTKEWTIQDFNELDKNASNSYAPLFLLPPAVGIVAAGGPPAWDAAAPYVRPVALAACLSLPFACHSEELPGEFAAQKERLQETYDGIKAEATNLYQQIIESDQH